MNSIWLSMLPSHLWFRIRAWERANVVLIFQETVCCAAAQVIS
jgi:hypothetical protein